MDLERWPAIILQFIAMALEGHGWRRRLHLLRPKLAYSHDAPSTDQSAGSSLPKIKFNSAAANTGGLHSYQSSGCDRSSTFGGL
jgi:hypothetical protein